MQNPRAGSSLASGTVEPEERRGSGIVGIGNLIDDDVNPQVRKCLRVLVLWKNDKMHNFG